MGSKTAVLTIVAKNHLPFARCLMDSVRRLHPEFLRVVVLADRIEWLFSPAQEQFDIVLSSDLQVPASEWFHFKYSLVELTTALRPYALEWLFHRYGVENALYLDADTKLYAPLSPLIEQLQEASIVLAPQLTASLNDSFSPSEADILQMGAYNPGFLALAANLNAFRFLRWCQDKLHDRCFAGPSRGVAAGQRWIDLAPGLFDGVVINREPGYGVGYWNLNGRQIRKQSQGYTVNGCPLYFFHFSGFDPEKPSILSERQNRFQLSDLGEAQDLVEEYRQDLFRNGYMASKHWPYAYGAFRNGVQIPDTIRRVPRTGTRASQQTYDPFSTSGFDAIVRYWNEPQPDPDGHPTRLTRLAYHYYLTRSDLHPRMPDALGRDQVQFLEWMVGWGVRETDWGETFLRPLRAALAAEQAERAHKRKEQGMAELRAALPSGLPPACRRILEQTPGALPALRRKGMTEDACVAWCNETVIRNGIPDPMTRLAHEIYESRPDLRQAFPDPSGADAAAFVRWFLTCAPVELRLDERFLAPFRSQWERQVSAIEGYSRRLAHRAKFARMAVGARINARLAAASGLLGGETAAAEPAAGPKPHAGLGFNLIGYARSESGVGEAARAAALAARSCGIPIRLKNIQIGDPSRQQDYRAGPDDTDFPFPFHILYVNADFVPMVVKSLGQDFFTGHYTIGFWHWELEEFPQRWMDSFRAVQEVWTPSAFCQDAFSRKSPAPVVRIPHCVQVEAAPSLGRAQLGLPEGKFLFLTVFDMRSIFERKNPLAVVEAFRLAFGRSSGCHLVVKINNGHQRPDLIQTLRESCADVPATIIDRVSGRDEVTALMQACDCLVSLHRSEGFGLPIAEAMYLGRPVIATAYSGNLEFTHPGNSFLVSYKMRRVGPGNEPYPAGAWWADPSVADAARHMKSVFECTDLRRQVAEAGSAYVREHLSPQAVGRRMRERLAHLAAQHGW